MGSYEIMLTVKFLKDEAEVLNGLTEELLEQLKEVESAPFNLAVSGGGTAKTLFRLWAGEYRFRFDWDVIRFFWVDERCVAPDDDESNYKHACELLLKPLGIPEDHFHRIKGECDPESEAGRYDALVRHRIELRDGKPCFDCIILGVGEDGHTASIFPDTMPLLADSRNYAVSRHPLTGQHRITMTGTLILNAKKLLIPVVGTEKTDVVKRLFDKNGSGEGTPAGDILNRAENAAFYTDRALV